ncbi:MAG: 5'/3'-nucleotidase SurE [Syntrophorhabdales bacterium]
MLILLSNDDGVDSEGLHALKESLAPTDEVWVVAPEAERTCIGHAITLHKPLRVKDLGGGVFSTNGTPADSVLLALSVVLPKRPDLIIAGINKGPNMGRDVAYSGTVAAAKEGGFAGIASLAVSLNARKDFLFPDACRAVLDVVARVRASGLPPSTFLNVNIPNVPRGAIKGFMVTSLGKRIYNDNIIERRDPRGGTYYWIGGDGERFEAIEGTDLHAVDQGYISLTPLHWDLTSYVTMAEFKDIFKVKG